MKNLLLASAILFGLNANAQRAKDDHLFLQSSVGIQDNMLRITGDIGVQMNNRHRFALYAETFETERYKKDGEGYRKFFLGTRYSYIVNLSERCAVIPNLGVDVRLSGSQMISIRPQVTLQQKVSKKIGLFTSGGYQIYNRGVREYNPRIRMEAGMNVYF